jgi:hypothetical protein
MQPTRTDDIERGETQERLPDFSESQVDALAEQVDWLQYRSDASVNELEKAAKEYAKALLAAAPRVPDKLSERTALATWEALHSLNMQHRPYSVRLRVEHWAREEIARLAIAIIRKRRGELQSENKQRMRNVLEAACRVVGESSNELR